MEAGSVGDSRSDRIQRFNPVATLRYAPGFHPKKQNLQGTINFRAGQDISSNFSDVLVLKRFTTITSKCSSRQSVEK